MESAARAAGIADYPKPTDTESRPEPEPEHTTELDTTTPTASTHPHPDRVPIPLSQRRSFSTTRSRANSAFTTRTLDLEDAPTVPPTPGLAPFNTLPTTFATAPARAPAPAAQDPVPASQPQASEIGQAITTTAGAEEEDGPPWDPLHPCWPHPNPHVPLSSHLYHSTRIIRLQRDYRLAGDLYPQYITSFPEILEPYLRQEDFSAFVRELNARLASVFDPGRKRHWIDAVMGLMTGWLWDDAGLSCVKSGFRSTEVWMERWNQGPGRERGVQVIGLRRTAFLTLDLQVPDPSGFIVAEGEGADAGAVQTLANGNGAAANGVPTANGNGNGGAGYAYGHVNGFRTGEYSTVGPTTDGGTSVVGATTDGAAEYRATHNLDRTTHGLDGTTDALTVTDADGRSFITDEAGGTSGYYTGTSTSLRTSESFSRRRDGDAGGIAPRPEVPPIPLEYLGAEREGEVR